MTSDLASTAQLEADQTADEPTGNRPDAAEPTSEQPAAEGASAEGEQPAAPKPPPWADGNYAPPPELPPGIFTRWPWFGFLLPLIVFMLVGSLEPTPPPKKKEAPPAKKAAAPTNPGLPGKEKEKDLKDKTPVDDLFTEPEISEEETPTDEAFEGENAAEKPAEKKEEEPKKSWFDLGIPYSYYPLIYTVKIALTVVAMIIVLPTYRTFYPVRVGSLAIMVGAVGIVIWIGLWKFQQSANLLEGLGMSFGERSAFNPWVEIENPLWRYGFLLIRFFGLVAVVPVIEEFFLRGFLIRYIVTEKFWEVPFGYANDSAFMFGTLVPVMMHPGELLPAAVWFSLVTWLMLRTRNIWDCVAAHAVTNLLLGIYVIISGDWELM